MGNRLNRLHTTMITTLRMRNEIHQWVVAALPHPLKLQARNLQQHLSDMRDMGTEGIYYGGYGYSTEFDVERYFRDAPLMIVGEGTNEIQRNVIAGQLVARGGI